VFVDKDGSVTGSAGKYVVVTNPFLLTPDCGYREAWNAYVCGGRYVALTIENYDVDPSELAPVQISRADGVAHDMFGAPRDGPNTLFVLLYLLRVNIALVWAARCPSIFACTSRVRIKRICL
jgi:hypothetical protein